MPTFSRSLPNPTFCLQTFLQHHRKVSGFYILARNVDTILTAYSSFQRIELGLRNFRSISVMPFGHISKRQKLPAFPRRDRSACCVLHRTQLHSLHGTGPILFTTGQAPFPILLLHQSSALYTIRTSTTAFCVEVDRIREFSGSLVGLFES